MRRLFVVTCSPVMGSYAVSLVDSGGLTVAQLHTPRNASSAPLLQLITRCADLLRDRVQAVAATKSSSWTTV